MLYATPRLRVSAKGVLESRSVAALPLERISESGIVYWAGRCRLVRMYRRRVVVACIGIPLHSSPRCRWPPARGKSRHVPITSRISPLHFSDTSHMCFRPLSMVFFPVLSLRQHVPQHTTQSWYKANLGLLHLAHAATLPSVCLGCYNIYLSRVLSLPSHRPVRYQMLEDQGFARRHRVLVILWRADTVPYLT
jgi:hypothetical protein